MDKIVIVSNKPEPDYGLLHLLNVLFPNCEVNIVPRQIGSIKECPASCSSSPFTMYTGKRDSKHFNYR
jgi:hypothetical protein